MDSQPGSQTGSTHTGKSVWQVLGMGAIAWTMFSAPSYAQPTQTLPPPESIPCGLFDEPQRFNTQTNDEGVISIGHQPGRPYRLILTRASDTTLRSLRVCVLDAFWTRSRSGRYILVGSFERRSDAERNRRTLRQAGYAVRVAYRR